MSKTFAIITVCKNAETTLSRLLASIEKQVVPPEEFIVIDGASSDSSVNIIKQAESVTYWVSEPDSGIASAMNKAVSISKAEYLLFLHADDFFYDQDSTRKIQSIIDDQDIVFFDQMFMTNGAELSRKCPRGFNIYTRFKTPVFHQSCLIHRRLFDQLGGYDESFKITMDYEFFLRCYLADVSTFYVNDIITVFSNEGVSSFTDKASLTSRLAEERKTHFKHSSKTSFWGWIYRIWWLFYPKYKMKSAN